MNDDLIIAISREYAEEKCGKENESPMYFGIAENEMEEKLRWLSTRFCLVEKSKLTKMYKEAVDGKCELEKMQPQNTYAKNSILMKVGMNAGCAYTLKSLFPEIAKEVEG